MRRMASNDSSEGEHWRGATGLLHSIINALPIVIYAFDRDGTVLLAEGRALEGMDSAPGATVGRSIIEVFDQEPLVEHHLRRALNGERHTADLVLGRNGRSYRVWYTPWTGADGRVTMVYGLALDITESERTQGELRVVMGWLQSLLQHLPVAIFKVDAEGVLEMARGSILPASTEATIGLPIAAAYRHYPELVRGVSGALRGDDQTFSLTSGAREIEFLVHGLREQGRDQGAIGILVDVTEQRRAAVLAAENEWRSRFLAEISHELRTPLNSVIGFADLLMRPEFDRLTEAQTRHVKNIRAAAGHLLALINELLDVSKIRAGHIEVARERVEVSQLLAEVAERMAPNADAAGVTLSVALRTHRPAAADRRRVFQIALNLVSNAIKFTPPGGHVRLSCFRRFGTVTVVVADDGMGIARGDLDRIFEDFVQLSSGVRAATPGTGLGLSLSRRLARAMGGDLTVRSSVGRGSSFLLSLPVWPDQPPP